MKLSVLDFFLVCLKDQSVLELREEELIVLANTFPVNILLYCFVNKHIIM